MTLPAAPERAQLCQLLEELAQAVEDLVYNGLGAASEATRQTLAVSFQAASGKRLLRLGSTLRVAVEELGLYANNNPRFSRRRYCFFLNRAWTLSRGMLHALHQADEEQWERLTWRPGGTAVAELDVVTLGVIRRVVPGAFVAFEFRLRALNEVPELVTIGPGSPLIWSCVFGLRPGVELAAEAYLHLPQPQKFKPADLLPGQVVRVGPAEVAADGRLSLTPDSQVTVTDQAFTDWAQLLTWDREAALNRVLAHQPGPFDLEIELQEEIVLEQWQVGEPEQLDRESQLVYPITTPHCVYHATVGEGPLGQALTGWRNQATRPPLFGVLHYEMCRLMLQPLTVFATGGPQSLMLCSKGFDAVALVRALKPT